MTDLSKNLEKNIIDKYDKSHINLKSYLRLLYSNSIAKNLNKGYSILMNKNKIIKSVKNIKLNSNLKIKNLLMENYKSMLKKS